MSETPASETTKQTIEIDFYRVEDAPGIARLFRQVYGEGYPIRTCYLPDQLIEENAAGHIISCVARTAAGEVLSEKGLPSEGKSRGSMTLFDQTQVARTSIDCIGPALGRHFNSFPHEKKGGLRP